MKDKVKLVETGERGAALIIALLSLALLLALAMGISLTAISELGVSRTHGAQTVALQAAEAGLNHAASLVSNYNPPPIDPDNPGFTPLLMLRGASFNSDYLGGNNPFVTANSSHFTTGSVMIDYEDATRGYQLRDAVTGALVPDVYYRVSLIDDEPITSTADPKVPNFNPGVTYRESVGTWANNAAKDQNNRVVVYSTGTYQNTSVTLEGWVAFLPYPALSSNKNIEISGNADIRGAYGGVHSNGDLITGTGGGSNWWVEQTATASGTAVGNFSGHVGGFYGGGQAPLSLPPFVTTAPVVPAGPNTSPRLEDYLIRRADVILMDPYFAEDAHNILPNGNGNPGTRRLANLAERLNVPYDLFAAALDSDGNNGNNVQQDSAVAVTIVRDANGLGTPTRAPSTASVGWSYSNDSNPWNIANNSAGGRTFYVVGQDNYNNGPLSSTNPSTPNGGNVKITGDVGAAGAPLQVTIMATGSIDIQGNPNLAANLNNLQTPLLPPFVRIDLLMAAVEDIRVRGDFNAAIAFTGITYAGEQVDLSGNGSINGQVIAFGNQNVSNSLVEGPSGDRNRSVITGSFELTLNSGNAVGKISLYSWRQIKR